MCEFWTNYCNIDRKYWKIPLRYSSKFRHFKVFYFTIFSDSSQEMNKFWLLFLYCIFFFFPDTGNLLWSFYNLQYIFAFINFFMSFFFYRPSIKNILVFVTIPTNQKWAYLTKFTRNTVEIFFWFSTTFIKLSVLALLVALVMLQINDTNIKLSIFWRDLIKKKKNYPSTFLLQNL